MFLAAGVVHAGDLPTGDSGKVFVDVSHIDQRTNGAGNSDTNADLKRFYINVDHRSGEVWSAHLTTDIQWHRHDDPTDLWAKHACLQGDFSKAFVLRLGAASTPWVGLVDHWYGYRYVESDLVMLAKVDSSADCGAAWITRCRSSPVSATRSRAWATGRMSARACRGGPASIRSWVGADGVLTG